MNDLQQPMNWLELLEMEEDSVKELMGMTDLSIVKDLSEVDASYTPEININQEFLIHFLQANLSRTDTNSVNPLELEPKKRILNKLQMKEFDDGKGASN